MSHVHQVGSSPYAKGGGGSVLEHEYAGAVLAKLLLGQPVDGLGDDFTPYLVTLQKTAESPVDDVTVRGVSPGGERRLRVACRREVRLGRGTKRTVLLFAAFVRALWGEGAEIDAGRMRLGLAVERASGPVRGCATKWTARRGEGRRCPTSSIGSAPRVCG